jgi:hypothetical protein
MRSYLGQMMKHVVEMLSDPRVLLRQALTKLVNRLMKVLTPTPVVEILLERLNDEVCESAHFLWVFALALAFGTIGCTWPYEGPDLPVH